MSNCSQCHGCAYKPGSAANLEPQTHMRGVLAALGGFPFFCHESLGWKEGMDGYPNGRIDGLVILSNRAKLADAGIPVSALGAKAEAVRRNLRACEGWKASVARLKALGWFANKDLAALRREKAKIAALALARFCQDNQAPAKKEAYRVALKTVLEWFVDQAEEDKIEIGWLVGDNE